ncbi:MAG: TraM recognition domain-containing protein [Thermoleophilaceae bacterium]
MYERYLLNLFRALEARPQTAELSTVIGLLDPAELAMYVRDLEDGSAAGEIGDYLQRLTPDQARDLRGLADRLALLIEGAHGDRLTTAPNATDEIDLLRAVREGAVVVFSLNSSSYGATAKLIGNMVIQDLKAVCGAIEAESAERRPAVVAVDEFSGLDGDQVAGLFQRARSAGLSLMLATQELADLRRVDEGFDEQVLGNVEWVLAGRQNNPASAELVAGLAGTEEVWVHTFQTDDVALRGRAPFPRESGMGTKHRGREYVVSPDEIKALGVGRMVLVEKNPHRVETVDVLPADHPARRGPRAA